MALKRERSGETRRRILDAGLGLFSKKGYLGATTKEISAEAGVAEVTLFRYFPSKESLFEEVIRTYSFLPALKGLVGEIEGLPYRDAMDRIAHVFLDSLSRRKEMIRIMHSEIPQYPAKTRQIYHNFVDETVRTLADYLRGLQSKGILRRFDPEMAARAFLGMFFAHFNAHALMMKKKLSREESERLIGEFVGIFVEGTLA